MYLYTVLFFEMWKVRGACDHHLYRTFLYDAGRNIILQTDQKSNLIAPGMTLLSQIKTALSDLIPSVYDDDLYMDKRRRGRNAMGWDCLTKKFLSTSTKLLWRGDDT